MRHSTYGPPRDFTNSSSRCQVARDISTTSKLCAELVAPVTHPFVRNRYTALEQQFINSGQLMMIDGKRKP